MLPVGFGEGGDEGLFLGIKEHYKAITESLKREDVTVTRAGSCADASDMYASKRSHDKARAPEQGKRL